MYEYYDAVELLTSCVIASLYDILRGKSRFGCLVPFDLVLGGRDRERQEGMCLAEEETECTNDGCREDRP